MWHLTVVEYCVAIDKDRFKAILGKWIYMETIRLNEINQTQKFRHHIVSLVWEIWSIRRKINDTCYELGIIFFFNGKGNKSGEKRREAKEKGFNEK